ncbi:MAG TPA: TIGR01777 family oxidoreductase [Acidimicrobiales bacterium]|nr:TIGR01777 family oxidoreductase [Acidimicrobiales bacterium]
MRVLVSGSSGLIGSALVTGLRAGGHDVVRLVRRAPSGPDEVRWDPSAGTLDPADLGRLDGIVHLAGEGIGEKRWTPAQKRRIRDSRIDGTRLLAETAAALEPTPSVFVCGSAIGYYGLRGDEVLTEASSAGTGFLAELTVDWEAAAAPAEAAGIRTVFVRTGIVIAPKGGAFGRLLPFLKLGLGGRLGTGRQWWSWITLEDEVRLLVHALETESLRGPVNATAPQPATNAEIVKAAGRVLGRPTVLPVPKFALSLVMGAELTEEVILAGQRARPEAAEASGFTFSHPDLDSGMRAMLKG